jgi:hypothetical protein
MKKLRSRCLILISSLLFLACGGQARQDVASQQLTDYLQKDQDYTLKPDIKTVFVLTEQNCMTCNQKFAHFMQKQLKKTSCLFLVLTRGARFDTSMFPENQSNVLHDSPQNITAPLFQSSKALMVADGHIKKTLVIDARKLEAQLDTLESWLK